MLKRLRHWLRGANPPPSAGAAPDTAAGQALSVALPNGPRFALADDIEQVFCGCVLGASSLVEGPPNAFERRALHELDRLAAGKTVLSERLPRLPAIIPRVMHTLRDDASSAAELAREIGRDTALIGEVVRLANSPYYRSGQTIDSLEGAIVRVGRTAIRQLVSRAVFKPLLNVASGHFTRLSSATLWEQAEKTAAAADCLAGREGGDRFQAYLSGIVHNVGFNLALQVLDSVWDDTDVPRSLEFRNGLVRRARQFSTRIAREWTFTPDIIDALASYADTDTGDGGLRDILHTADKMAKVHTLAARGLVDKAGDGPVRCRLRGKLTDSCTVCYARLGALDVA